MARTTPQTGAPTLALLVVGLLGGQPARAQDVGDVFRVEQLAPGVYAALVLPQPDAYAFANSLVVLGERGVLVVDTQQSPRAARALIREIETLTELPVRWVVNTHWHGDHVYGNSAYRARWPNVEFFATQRTLDGMQGLGAERRAEELASLPESIREREGWLEAGSLPDGEPLTPELRAQVSYSLRIRRLYLDELEELQIVYPENVVEQRTVLDLGGRTVTMMSVGWAHTEGDLVVLLGDERILAVGDLLEEGLPWIADASVTGWASSLERLQELDPHIVLPSHAKGPGDRSLLDRQAALLRDVVRGARNAPAPDALAAVAPHRAFMAELGITPDAFDRWATEAVQRAATEPR